MAAGLLAAVPTLPQARAESVAMESLEPMDPVANSTVKESDLDLPRVDSEPEPVVPETKVPDLAPLELESAPTSKPGEEIVGLRTQTSKVFATENPNELRVEAYAEPVHYKDAGGKWRTINEDLVVDSAGDARPKGEQRPVKFGESAADATLGAIDFGGGRSARFSLRGGSEEAERSIDGSVATYEEAVPGVDLELEADNSTIKETIVLKTADAPTSYDFDLRTTDLTPVLVDDDRRVELRDGDKVVGVIPRGWMEDSSGGSDGVNAISEEVTYRLAKTPSGWRLTVSADSEWIRDPARVFPIKVDPTVAPLQVTDDTYVQSDSTNPKYADTQLKVGRCVPSTPDCGSTPFDAYTLMKFDFRPIGNHTITGASLVLYQTHQYSCTVAETEARVVMEYWNPLTTVHPGPSVGAQIGTKTGAKGYSGCAAGEEWIPLSLTQVNAWRTNHSSNYGLRLGATNMATMHGWKKFASAESTAGHPKPRVEYTMTNSPPSTPTAMAPASGSWHTSTLPTLSARFSDPEADPGVVAFQVFDAVTNVRVAGWPNDTSAVKNAVEGQTVSWTPPTLPHGLYRWTTHADDIGSVSGFMPDQTFGFGPKPTLTKSLTPGKAVRMNKGETIWYRLTVTNPSNSDLKLVELKDEFGSALRAIPSKTESGGVPCPLTVAGCVFDYVGNKLTIPNWPSAGLVPKNNGSLVYDVPAVITGSDGSPCSLATNVATLKTDRLEGVSATLGSVLGCEGGLGREGWFEFAKTDIGPGSWAGVNVANGNLVVQHADTTPVQGAGRLALGTVRTYNSQANTGFQLPGAIAKGWTLSATSGGVAPLGLILSGLSSFDVKVPVTMVDEDGTRHTFALKGVPNVSGLSLGQLLRLDPHTNVCIDQTYRAPAGVNLSLFRYVRLPVGGSCGGGMANSTVIGYAAVRPDRTRTEFDQFGRVIAVRDAAGNTLHYDYELTPPWPITLGRLTSVWEKSSVCADGTQTTCRRITIVYNNPAKTAAITDPAGRVTTYSFSDVPGLPTTQLDSVQNPDQPQSTITYTYGCGSTNQLCTVSDLNGATTKFSYDASSGIVPARVQWMRSRRGGTTTAPMNPFVTWFKYASANGSNYTLVDTDRIVDTSQNPPVTVRRGVRQKYVAIDNAGRVGGIVEGAVPADPNPNDADPTPPDTVDGPQRVATFTWDTDGATCSLPEQKVDNNLCRVDVDPLDSAQQPEVTMNRPGFDGGFSCWCSHAALA